MGEVEAEIVVVNLTQVKMLVEAEDPLSWKFLLQGLFSTCSSFLDQILNRSITCQQFQSK